MPFDPRAYNGSIIDNTAPEVEPEIPQVDKDNDPFLFPENNNPDAGGFNASKFNEWTLYTYFDGKNVARHEFRNDKNWTPGDVSKGEYKLSGQSTYTEVVNPPVNKINDVTYYMYKGKNDHFLPDSDYNTKPIHDVVRMERFVFFRFTGSPLAGDALDNRLMAIDTMTKLIFAYSKPTEFKDVLGQKVPTKWESVDTATKVSGVSYPFYEYDPIGVVSPNGTVELFPQYVKDTENGYYDPRIGDPSRDVATYGKPGRSPYYVVAIEGDPFLYSVSSKKFSYRKNEYAVSDMFYEYIFADDGKTITSTEIKWNNNPEVNTYTHKSTTNPKLAVYVDSSGREIEFSLHNNNLELQEAGRIVGLSGFKDIGPLFADRVKGLTFIFGKKKMIFSDDGKTMTASGYSWQLLYGGKRNGIWKITSTDINDKVIYKKTSGANSGSFVGFKIEGDNKSDIVKWTDNSFVKETDIKLNISVFSDSHSVVK